MPALHSAISTRSAEYQANHTAMGALVTTSLWLFVVYLQTDRLRSLLLAGLVGA